mgnify:CR=1 FL=1
MEREARKTLKKTDRKRETTKSLEKESKMKRMRATDGEKEERMERQRTETETETYKSSRNLAESRMLEMRMRWTLKEFMESSGCC